MSTTTTVVSGMCIMAFFATGVDVCMCVFPSHSLIQQLHVVADTYGSAIPDGSISRSTYVSLRKV